MNEDYYSRKIVAITAQGASGAGKQPRSTATRPKCFFSKKGAFCKRMPPTTRKNQDNGANLSGAIWRGWPKRQEARVEETERAENHIIHRLGSISWVHDDNCEDIKKNEIIFRGFGFWSKAQFSKVFPVLRTGGSKREYAEDPRNLLLSLLP